MFTDYPKGKQITAIMQAVGILISAYLLFYPETTFLRARAHTKHHTQFVLMATLHKQSDLNEALHAELMQNDVFLGGSTCLCISDPNVHYQLF